jgi:2-amino-4-hydroxy-6-hydroxymethyldihydropteridine diphosphokinase
VNTRRRKATEGGPSCGAAKQHRTSGDERGTEGAPLHNRRSPADERGTEGAPLHGGASRRVFLSLGSNLGDREATLAAACEALAALPGTTVVAASSLYETAPQERADQPEFLNQVVCLDTALEPSDLLAECQRIEKEHGRVRELRFGPRTLDVDILLVQDVESRDPQLELPHPRMLRRAFVLVPLAEIWGTARGMPDLDVRALAEEAAREQPVRLYRAAAGGPSGDD